MWTPKYPTPRLIDSTDELPDYGDTEEEERREHRGPEEPTSPAETPHSARTVLRKVKNNSQDWAT